jgi:hypothetical protein
VVSWERHEAQVDYDAARCSVADLIAAVSRAADPAMPVPFAATLKK